MLVNRHPPNVRTVGCARLRVRAALACVMALAPAISRPCAAQEGHGEQAPTAEIQRKSGGKALALSLFGTLLPVAMGALSASGDGSDAGAVLAVTGVVLGPSLGHFYAERPVYATGMAVLRGGAVVAALSGTSCETNCDNRAALSVLTGLVALVSVYVDIATAPGAVRARNRRLGLTPAAWRGGRVGVVATMWF